MGATHSVLAGVFVCSVASSRRVYSSGFLTRFAWLCYSCVGCRRAGTTLTGAAVACVYGLAWTCVATGFSVLEASGGSDFGSASGVRPARAP